MKEAKDEIDSAFRETMDTRIFNLKRKSRVASVRGSQISKRKVRVPRTQRTRTFWNPPRKHFKMLRTRMRVDKIEDLGFRIGRMRLGKRIGGHYRPRIPDEVYDNDYL